MKDPVCGMSVAEPPKIKTVWNQQTYGFCNPSCLEKFKSNPDHYLKSNPVEMAVVPQAKSKLLEFLPLIIIFSLVLTLSLGNELYHGSWVAMRFMQNFMAAFFIIFGGLKLVNWRGFVEAYQTYDILAKKSRVYAYAYPLIEVGLGFAYLLSWQLVLINFVTVTVMAVSSIGVAQALRKKQKIQCACLGVLFKIPMTKITLLEDLLMGFMAIGMLFLKN